MSAPSDEPPAVPRLPPAAPMPPPDPGQAPFLPAPPPVSGAATTTEPLPFDAKAMVESQRHVKENPAYGALPRSTPESREAARRLRQEASRKRNRDTATVWIIALVVFGGLAAAGYFAYRAYQADQDRRSDERAEAARAEADRDALGALDEPSEIVDGLDAIDDPAAPSAGGALDVLDDAQAVVDDLNAPDGVANGDPPTADSRPADTTPAALTEPPPVAPTMTLTEVVPADVLATATRLLDTEGFEIYLVEVDTFTDADPGGYAIFLEWANALPQASPDSPVFDVLPSDIGAGTVGLALRREGDDIVRGIIRSVQPELHVDYTP